MSEFEKYKYVDTIPRSNKVKRLFWNTTWLFLFRTTPRWGFNKWRICLLKLFGAKIGKGSRVLPTCKVWAPWNLEMGEFSALGEYVDCYCMDKIIIGSKVAISQRSFLCTGTHDISNLLRPLVTKPISINNHAWICAESFIHPGVTIGEGAIIAARSVVLEDVKPFEIVAGNPVKFIRKRIISKLT